MEPFVIAVGAPLKETQPEGWALQPVGVWEGRESLVAYNALQHDVLVTGLELDQRTWDNLNGTGWEPQIAGVSGQLLWVKHRLIATRAALNPNALADRPSHNRGLGGDGRALRAVPSLWRAG